MNKKNLIVYDIESGSTREIAEIIAEKFLAQQISVDIRSIQEKITVENNDLVIVGSPNWYGKPAKKITTFLKENKALYGIQWVIK